MRYTRKLLLNLRKKWFIIEEIEEFVINYFFSNCLSKILLHLC